MHKGKLFTLVITFISTFSLSYVVNATEDRIYILARAPQVTPQKTIKHWQPFVNYLSKATGIKIKLKVYEKRDSFQADLKKGTPDFYYGNPGYAVVMKKLHNYRPLVRSGNKQLKGIITVKSDSNIKSIKQLNNKKITFPGPNAFAASLYLRSQLKNNEKIDFTPTYVRGHDTVYKTVLRGKSMAGGGVYRTLGQEKQENKKQLRVIYETPGLSPHPLAAHPRVAESVSKKITAAILDMQNNKKGKSILSKIKLKKPVAADYKRDYMPIEDIAISMYSSFLKIDSVYLFGSN